MCLELVMLGCSYKNDMVRVCKVCRVRLYMFNGVIRVSSYSYGVSDL